MRQQKGPPGEPTATGENRDTRDCKPSLADVQVQLATFASCVFTGNDTVEIRRLPSKRSTWHAAAELPDLAAQLTADNGRGENIYIGANPRTQHGGTKSGAVALARCLFVDFDGMEPDEARARWESARLPEPTLTVNSGHGVHCYWRLTEPVTDLAVWSDFQGDLAALLGSDPSVHDSPRIMRLPGFVNQKPPAAPCYIVDANPERIYDLADLHEHIPERTDLAVSTDLPTNDDKPMAATALDVLARAARYAEKWPGVAQGGRNNAAVHHAAQLTHDFALSDIEAYPILAAWNARNTPPLDDAELRSCLANGRRYGKSPVACKADTQPQRVARAKHYSPRAILQWRPFPVDVLPEPLRSLVIEGARAIGCDPSMIALPALAAVASVIGTTRRIRLKRTWCEPAVLWAAIVAYSGTLKSPAQEYALRPLMRLQADGFRRYAEAMEQYERDKLTYERDLAQWKRQKGDSGPPEKPQEPKAERFVCADATIEALPPIRESNPRSVLLARDELAGWLGSFDQYKSGRGGDSACWLELHRAGPLIIDRKTGKRITYVPRAAVSVCGTIQPDTLRRSLGREHFENGLAARLLLAMPPRQRKRWTDDDVAPGTVERFASMLARLRELRHNTDDNGEPVPVDVPLSDDGRRAWVAFYDEHAGRQHDTHDGDLAAAFSKLEGYAARFALVFHFIRWTAIPDDDRDTIGPESIEAGAELARWFCAETERLYGMFSETDDDRERRELVELIRSRGGSVTVRDLQRGPRQYREHKAAFEALAGLVRDGLGRWDHQSTNRPGQPPKRFCLCGAEAGDSGDGDSIAAGAAKNGDSVTVASVTTKDSNAGQTEN